MKSLRKVTFTVILVLSWALAACGGGGGGGGPILMVNSADDINDGTCDAAHCSLREAIDEANSLPEPAKIRFNIGGGGQQVIQPTVGLPALFEPMTIDGATQPGYTGVPLIILDGSLLSAEYAWNGLDVRGGETVLNGLGIINFSAAGIYMHLNGGNSVTGCYIGVEPNGTLAGPNGGDGIWIESGDGNIIGGSGFQERNLISANLENGVRIASDENFLFNNFIGTDFTGASARGNSSSGVFVSGNNNQIGGIAGSSGNVISGNLGDGVVITGTRNEIQGNVIGLTMTGEASLGNLGNGVSIQSDLNLVGGTQQNNRNVISANGENGVEIQAGAVLVQGNYIGLDGSGTLGLGNHASGVYAFGMGSIQIGGSDAGAMNVISANQLFGVYVEDGSSEVSMYGNRIGTDATGMSALGNIKGGIRLAGTEHQVGAAFPGGRNLISGNGGPGVAVVSGSTGIVIRNNLIGTDQSGSAPLGNGMGIEIGLGAGSTSVTIGGSSAGQGNVISGNEEEGVLLYVGATLQGNYIGTDGTGLGALGNGGNGILVKGSGNVIGGTGSSNTIAFNALNGVLVLSESGGATGNSILSNSIHDNGLLGIAIDEQAVIPNDSQDYDTGDNNRQNFPVLVSAVSDPVAVSSTFHATLNSSPGTVYTVEFFTNAACDLSGYGEGQRMVNSITVTTNVNGLAALDAFFPSTVFDTGNFITATATDPYGNTSGFSNCIQVTEEGADTPTPVDLLFTPEINAYCRFGPDPIFGWDELAMQGQAYRIDGRNLENTWLYLLLTPQLGCWVPVDVGTASGDTRQVRVLAVIPTPTAVPSCAQYTTPTTCAQHAECTWNRMVSPAVCQNK